MAETKNTEKQNIEIQKEEEKRESVRKADAAVKSHCMILQALRFFIRS